MLSVWSLCILFCIKVRGFEILKTGENIEFIIQKHIQNPDYLVKWSNLQK